MTISKTWTVKISPDQCIGAIRRTSAAGFDFIPRPRPFGATTEVWARVEGRTVHMRGEYSGALPKDFMTCLDAVLEDGPEGGARIVCEIGPNKIVRLFQRIWLGVLGAAACLMIGVDLAHGFRVPAGQLLVSLGVLGAMVLFGCGLFWLLESVGDALEGEYLLSCLTEAIEPRRD